MKLQIQFIAFPGVEPLHVEDGWPHLPLPWKKVSDEDPEVLGDVIMELVDWLIEDHPDKLRIEDQGGEIEPLSDYSIRMASEIGDICGQEGATRGRGGCWSEWYKDVTITDFEGFASGIVVRVATFKT
jgi:hypothetical protein